MAAILFPARSLIPFQCVRLIARTSPQTLHRALSTLSNNPHIYIHDQSPTAKLLTLLPTSPPNPSLAIGTTTVIPPTPETLEENPHFLRVLHEVLKDHAVHDPEVIAQAGMYASQAGSALGSGGVFFPRQQQASPRRRQRKNSMSKPAAAGDGAGGASAQGGMGGAGRGGYIHVSDQRQPPDFGRVAWPEDIFGSLELDGRGEFVDGTGRYQEAGTYRICTREGVLGLSAYLRDKLVERLKELEMLEKGRE